MCAAPTAGNSRTGAWKWNSPKTRPLKISAPCRSCEGRLMKTLIIGGTGGIGGYIALALEKQGHKVTVSSRNKPVNTPVAHMPFLKGSYFDGSITKDQLRG